MQRWRVMRCTIDAEKMRERREGEEEKKKYKTDPEDEKVLFLPQASGDINNECASTGSLPVPGTDEQLQDSGFKGQRV
jgi:hypothetical protein